MHSKFLMIQTYMYVCIADRVVWGGGGGSVNL